MTTSSNKRLIRQLIEKVWNAGDTDRVPEFFSEEICGEMRALHDRLTDTFPDLHIDIEDLIAEGDRVVTRLSFEGTHEGTFRGIPPTGRRVRFSAIRIYRVVEDRVVESWANQDALGLIEQLTVGEPA